jgi:elongation of very long chain fatty acids protein 4
MYSYYFLASFGSRFRGWLWWKRYLTSMQISQFFIVFAHAVYSMREVAASRCRFPMWMGAANVAYMVAMIVLFSAFYARAYPERKAKPGAKKSE